VFRSLSLFSGSNVSLKNIYRYTISTRDKVRATIAGYMNQVSSVSGPEVRFLAQTENPAPIIGPKRNPIENAIPISAIPRVLVLGEEISVIMAVDKVTFPLDSPPEIGCNYKQFLAGLYSGDYLRPKMIFNIIAAYL
jgi:hypothetical protein